MLTRRTFLAFSTVLAGCGGGGGSDSAPDALNPGPGAPPPLAPAINEPFRRGDPANQPLVLAPAGPAGLAEWVGEDVIAGFVQAGFFVIGAHWPGLDGGVEDFGAQNAKIPGWLAAQSLGRKPMLYAQSRGGLQLLNFACDHPDSFMKIAALYPVTDPLVYPGEGEPLWRAWGTTEASFPVLASTPNLRAASLRGRPIKIWHGDQDAVVPKQRTTDVFAAASGAEVVTLPGVGHVPLWLPEIGAWLKA